MDSGFGDRETDMQQRGIRCLGKRISLCNPCNEIKEATTENKWATKKRKITNKYNYWEIIMWKEKYMDKGGVNPTKKKFLKSMCNKHV